MPLIFRMFKAYTELNWVKINECFKNKRYNLVEMDFQGIIGDKKK